MKHSSTIPAGVVCAADYERLAAEVIQPATLAYINGGSGAEQTLRANRTAFAGISIYNRVLRDCSHGSTRCRLLGMDFRHPILLAPTAYQRLLHPEGELAMARGAAATDTGMVVSTLASTSLEAIAAEQPKPRWLQLYLQPARGDTHGVLRRAEDAGYSAIMLTLDAPIQSPNYAAQRLGFRLPGTIEAVNLRHQSAPQHVVVDAGESVIMQGWMRDAPSWDDIAWLIRSTTLPIIAKGVSHPDDAARLLQAGIAAIAVSNHGGRALDGVPASLHTLPAIRERVGNDAVLIMDGGIRSGNDVFKALALGANAVMIGRLPLHALAVAGDLGVAHMVKLLCEELALTMALAGCPTLADIGPSAVAMRHLA